MTFIELWKQLDESETFSSHQTVTPSVIVSMLFTGWGRGGGKQGGMRGAREFDAVYATRASTCTGKRIVHSRRDNVHPDVSSRMNGPED